MYLIYVDEAGNTGLRKDPDQPIHMLGALLVEESKVEVLGQTMHEIGKRHFPLHTYQPGFELHGKDLFGGSGLFKGVDPAARIQACRDVIEALHTLEIDLMFTAVDKLKYLGGEHPHGLAFKFLIERVQEYLYRKSALGLLIADENQEMEQKLIGDLVKAKEIGTNWGYRPTTITNIIDSVHFVQSVNNNNIQCIDVVTYFLNKGRRIRENLLAQFIKDGTSTGTGMYFPQYLEATLKPAEKVVTDLHGRACLRLVASKIWP
jgi:hypothetical protein